jgi:hypothetical protein
MLVGHLSKFAQGHLPGDHLTPEERASLKTVKSCVRTVFMHVLLQMALQAVVSILRSLVVLVLLF